MHLVELGVLGGLLPVLTAGHGVHDVLNVGKDEIVCLTVDLTWMRARYASTSVLLLARILPPGSLSLKLPGTLAPVSLRVRPIREVVKAAWASEEREGASLIQE